jgi:hypothetical protein
MAHDGDPSLSPAYREALRLKAEGEDDAAIAAALDLTVEAVPALLVLAERKQARAGCTSKSGD